MEDIGLLIKDSFNVISLLLVFVFVLFDIRYPQIIKELEKDIPDKDLELERKNHRKKLMNRLLYQNLPLIIVNGILLYLFLPLLITVLLNSRFQIWHFDFVRTAFVIVIMLIAAFFFWSIYLAYLLLKRIVASS